MKMGKVFHYEGIGNVGQRQPVECKQCHSFGNVFMCPENNCPMPRISKMSAAALLGWYYQLDLDRPVGPYATKRAPQLAALAMVRLEPVSGMRP